MALAPRVPFVNQKRYDQDMEQVKRHIFVFGATFLATAAFASLFAGLVRPA